MARRVGKRLCVYLKAGLLARLGSDPQAAIRKLILDAPQDIDGTVTIRLQLTSQQMAAIQAANAEEAKAYIMRAVELMTEKAGA